MAQMKTLSHREAGSQACGSGVGVCLSGDCNPGRLCVLPAGVDRLSIRRGRAARVRGCWSSEGECLTDVIGGCKREPEGDSLLTKRFSIFYSFTRPVRLSFRTSVSLTEKVPFCDLLALYLNPYLAHFQCWNITFCL